MAALIDSPLYSHLVILLIITGVILIVKRVRKRGRKLPPSPWKLPIIGNMHQLLGAGDPHLALRELSRRYGPIMYLKLGQVDHIVVSSPEVAREILKTHDLNFAYRPKFIATTVLFDNLQMVVSPYGNYWRHLRKICNLELLSARRVKSFLPIREGENSSLVNSILSASLGKPVAINLTEKLLSISNQTTARAAVGNDCKLGPKFIAVAKRVIKLASGFNIADLFPSLTFLSGLLGMKGKLEKMRIEIEEIMDNIIMEHQNPRLAKNSTQEEAQDLLSVLSRIKDEDGDYLPQANLRAVIYDIFVGGTETTATTLIWAMAELMQHPEVMKKVQCEVRQVANGKGIVGDEDLDELHYMKLVIKETLRLHTPVPLLVPREAQETCHIMGYEIPSGSRIMINVWAMGRDPKLWEDADSFKPERFEEISVDFKGENFQFLPFGGGRRICPGVGFAMAIIELALAKLLFHFDWEIPDGKEVDMSESFGATLSKKLDLYLIATPRFPLKIDTTI